MTQFYHPVDVRELLAQLNAYPQWRRDALVTLLAPVPRRALNALLAAEPNSELHSFREVLEFTFSMNPLRPLPFPERRRRGGGGWFRRILPSRFAAWKPKRVICADELGVALWEYVRSREDLDQAATILPRYTRVKPTEIRLELFALRLHATRWAVVDLFDPGPGDAVNAWIYTSMEAFSKTFAQDDVHIFTNARRIRNDLPAITGIPEAPFGNDTHNPFYDAGFMMARLADYASQTRLTYGPHPAYAKLPWLKSATDVFVGALSLTNPGAVDLAGTAIVACYEGASDLVREFGVLPRK